MKKSELRNGMVIYTRDGVRNILLDGVLVTKFGETLDLADYDEDTLKDIEDPNVDIMRVESSDGVVVFYTRHEDMQIQEVEKLEYELAVKINQYKSFNDIRYIKRAKRIIEDFIRQFGGDSRCKGKR